jgi:hypothetical protein
MWEYCGLSLNMGLNDLEWPYMESPPINLNILKNELEYLYVQNI